MLLLKVLASFIALTVVLAAPVPTVPFRERSIGLLEDSYLPTKRAEGCKCAHDHSLKSVDAPRARRNREAHKKIKHHKVDVDEPLHPSEEGEIEKRTWPPVKKALRAVGLMRPSQNNNPAAPVGPNVNKPLPPLPPPSPNRSNTNQDNRRNTFVQLSGVKDGSADSHQSPARQSSSIGAHL